MDVTNTNLFAIMGTRLKTAEQAQGVISRNLANANTPGYRPFEVTRPAERRDSGVRLTRTSPMHMALPEETAAAQVRHRKVDPDEVKPDGNAVSVEREMIEAATVNAEFQATAGLFEKHVGMMKMAIGRGQ